MIKAIVRATGEVVKVRPERDGFFIDDDNNNVYKFDDLDFTYKEEEPSQDPFSDMIGSILKPTKEMQEDFKEQFYVNKFIEVFFDFFKYLYRSSTCLKDAFDDSLEYTKKLTREFNRQ